MDHARVESRLTDLSNRGARDRKCPSNRQWLSRISLKYLIWDLTSAMASPNRIRGEEAIFPEMHESSVLQFYVSP